MHGGIYVLSGAHVCAAPRVYVQRLLYLLRQCFSLNTELDDLVSLGGYLAQESPCLCLLSPEIVDGHHASLTFMSLKDLNSCSPVEQAFCFIFCFAFSPQNYVLSFCVF